MSTELPIQAPATPDFGPGAHSPTLPQSGFVLDFAAPPAVNASGEETVALFAAARLPGRFADIYGGRLEGAVQIVAVDYRTGTAYHNNAEIGHMVPLAAVMDPNPAPPQPGVAYFESTEMHFAVDLRTQLTLPPNAGLYGVFLWLDEMTSSLHEVRIPGGEPAAPAPQPPFGALNFRKSSQTPLAKGSEVVLHNSPKDRRVYGAVGGDAKGGPLTLLALDYRSRLLKSATFPVNELAFDFDLIELLGDPGWITSTSKPQKAFVLAVSRGFLSRVVVIEA